MPVLTSRARSLLCRRLLLMAHVQRQERTSYRAGSTLPLLVSAHANRAGACGDYGLTLQILSYYAISENADSLDLQFHDIAIFQEAETLQAASVANGARADDLSRIKCFTF